MTKSVFDKDFRTTEVTISQERGERKPVSFRNANDYKRSALRQIRKNQEKEKHHTELQNRGRDAKSSDLSPVMAQNELDNKHGKRRLLQGRRIENHQTLRLSSPSNTGALPIKPQALATSDINSVSSPTLGLPFDSRTHDSFKTRE